MPWQAYVGIGLGSWIAGFFLEYLLHWIMHRWALGFHIGHHREFFHDQPKVVALRTIDPRMDIKFFLLALLPLAPLMYFWRWDLPLLIWGALFWHIVIFYEACHAVMHYDCILPDLIRNSRLYRWWKGCHFEHHFHSPQGNYCVTLPVVDLLFGTYVSPRPHYEQVPHPKLKPVGEGFQISVPSDASENRA